jgi:hypothetical protein
MLSGPLRLIDFGLEATPPGIPDRLAGQRFVECAAPSKSQSTRTNSKPASSIGNSSL